MFTAVCVGAAGIGGLVGPDARRTDAELDVRVDVVDGGVQLGNQLVDAVAAEVRNVRETAAVLLIGGSVVKIGAWVEIVVHVQTVYVVVLHDFDRAAGHKIAYFGDTGVKIIVAVRVLDHPVGVHLGRVGAGQRIPLGVLAAGDAVGVNPRVQLQTALVGRLDPVFERIETVLRSGADRTGQVFAPREQIGLVERIARRSDL